VPIKSFALSQNIIPNIFLSLILIWQSLFCKQWFFMSITKASSLIFKR